MSLSAVVRGDLFFTEAFLKTQCAALGLDADL